MSLPILHLTGTPREQGRAHGEALRDDIAHNLAVYFDRYESEARLPRDEVRERAQSYLAAMQATSGDYCDGMRGIAEGSRFDVVEIAALNVRYELFYDALGRIAEAEAGRGDTSGADGCTAFAVLPDATANGHLLHGQNWDWMPRVRGAVLHTAEPDGMRTVSFTEAGIFGGKIGLNSAGIGLTINGMLTTEDDWSRMQTPFHVRCHRILHCSDFDDAVAVVTGEDRSCAANYMISQAPDRVADIEAAPLTYRMIRPDGQSLVHTNHFLDPEALGVVEPPKKRLNTYTRYDRMSRLLQGRINGGKGVSAEDLRGFLRDHDGHPYSLCRHEAMQDPPAERYVTVTSVIMDLHDLTMAFTDGPPCGSEHETVGLE